MILPVLFFCSGMAVHVPPRAKPKGKEEEKPIPALLLEASLPPPGTYERWKDNPFEPSMGKTNLMTYLTWYADTGDAQIKLRVRLRQAQTLLWAASPAYPPRPLVTDVQKLRRRFKTDQLFLYRLPIPTTPEEEMRLKNRLLESSRLLARLMFSLEEMVEDLKELRELRDKENPRWQANYDLTLAWMQERIIYLEEFSLALGQMRKEWPAHDPMVHTSWRLQAREKVQETPTKKRAREAEKLLQKLIADYPDTIWARMASEARKTSLSVEWQAVKDK